MSRSKVTDVEVSAFSECFLSLMILLIFSSFDIDGFHERSLFFSFISDGSITNSPDTWYDVSKRVHSTGKSRVTPGPQCL